MFILQLAIFSLELLHVDVGVTGNGFFTVDYSLLSTVSITIIDNFAIPCGKFQYFYWDRLHPLRSCTRSSCFSSSSRVTARASDQ